MSKPPPPASTDAVNALPRGTRLGEFELLSVLGVGGFSIVYLAFDHSLEREVAVKEYMPGSLASRHGGAQVSILSQGYAETFAIGLRSFVNEARLLAQFDHPSLLKIYRFWEANGTAYMTMPVYRGRTLRDVRRSLAAPPDERWVRSILEPLLGAIRRLHEERVYHRDIAPDNIMVEPDGRPVLLDFGAARRVIGDRQQSLTTILKPAYAPIEQYAEAGSVKQGPWTDLYALGATLHFVLLGRPPSAATTRAVNDDQIPLASQDLPGCSVEFARIVDWMLQPRPSDRPQNVAAVLDALDGRTPASARAVGSSDRFDAMASAGADRTAIPMGGSATSAASERIHVSADPPPVGASSPAEPPGPHAPRGGWLAGLWQSFFGASDGAARKPAAQVRRELPARLRAPDPLPPTPPLGAAPAGESTVLAKPLQVDAAGTPRRPEQVANPDADFTVILGNAAAAASPAATTLVLRIVQSDTAALVTRRPFEVPMGQTIIGRGDDAAIVLSDPQWSRRHALLHRDATGVSLSDLCSSNGSFVNDTRLSEGENRRLHLGHRIRIGSTVFVLGLGDDIDLPDLTGTLLGDRYRLLEQLHGSPKSTVYRAEKAHSKLPVAVKILSPQYANYPGSLEQFHAEAHVAARLQHPHICSLDDFGDAEIRINGRPVRVPFLAYELLSGGSLRDRLDPQADIGLETVESWLGDVAGALGHAHEHGVVHGNLKPSSIRFSTGSAAYLTDFAIADGAPSAPPLVGAPPFISPERWKGLPPTPHDDQYSLAVVVYRLLGGRYPYEGQEDEARRTRMADW